MDIFVVEDTDRDFFAIQADLSQLSNRTSIQRANNQREALLLLKTSVKSGAIWIIDGYFPTFSDRSDVSLNGPEFAFYLRAHEERYNISPSLAIGNTSDPSIFEDSKKRGYIDAIVDKTQGISLSSTIQDLFKNTST